MTRQWRGGSPSVGSMLGLVSRGRGRRAQPDRGAADLARILAAAAPSGSSKLSRDPQPVQQVRGVVGLYLNPPGARRGAVPGRAGAPRGAVGFERGARPSRWVTESGLVEAEGSLIPELRDDRTEMSGYHSSAAGPDDQCRLRDYAQQP